MRQIHLLMLVNQLRVNLVLLDTQVSLEQYHVQHVMNERIELDEHVLTVRSELIQMQKHHYLVLNV